MPVARAFSGSMEGAMPAAALITEPPRPQDYGLSLGTSPFIRKENYMDIQGGIASGIFHGGGEILTTGGRGEGKTTATKTMTISHLAYQAINPNGEIEQMRCFIDNRKQADPGEGQGVVGEWGPVVEALGVEVLDVDKMQLELLDPSTMNPVAQIRWMTHVARLAKRRALRPDQRLAIVIALEQLQRNMGLNFGFRTLEAKLRHFSNEDVHEFHARLDGELVERFRDPDDPTTTKQIEELLNTSTGYDTQPLIEAAQQVSRLYQLVLRGMFGKMYGGRTSLSSHLSRPAVMFNFAYTETEEYEFFESLRFQLMTSALKTGKTDLVPHLLVREEIQESITNPVLLESWALWSATRRSRHEITLSTTQYLTNLLTGDANSEVKRHITAILNGINGLILFKQPIDDEVHDILSRRGISDLDITEVSRLPLGVALIKFDGHDAFYNQFNVPPAMRHLIASRGAARRMVEGRRPVKQDPRIMALNQGRLQ